VSNDDDKRGLGGTIIFWLMKTSLVCWGRLTRALLVKHARQTRELSMHALSCLENRGVWGIYELGADAVYGNVLPFAETILSA